MEIIYVINLKHYIKECLIAVRYSKTQKIMETRLMSMLI